MLKHLRLMAFCVCIAASVGCNGSPPTAPAPLPTAPPPPPPVAGTDPNSIVTVELGGRVVNAEAGGPVGNVRVSVGAMSYRVKPETWVFPTDTATSGADGTFTLRVSLPSSWKFVSLALTGPAGYDDVHQRFEPTTAVDRPAIRMYPTLVIRPGESIVVRVDRDILLCGFGGAISCRRVLVEASPGGPVELEIVPHDTSEPMGLGDEWDESPVLRRLMVPPGGVPYVLGAGTARLTARR
jgi:hypothetical protein